MRGSNADWLFPGESGEHKEKISFSTQIVDRVEKSTGLRITVHQFRHAAGALILKHRPGEYELVRRLLGHKSVQTTIKFYLELETTQASEIFTDIVRNRVDFRPDASVTWIPGFNKRPSSPTAGAVAGVAPRRASRARCRSPNGRHPIGLAGRKRAGRRSGSSAAGRRAILPREPGRHRQPLWICIWTFCSATDGSTRPRTR